MLKNKASVQFLLSRFMTFSPTHFVFSIKSQTSLKKKKRIYKLNTLGVQHKLTALGGERTKGNIWILFLKK